MGATSDEHSAASGAGMFSQAFWDERYASRPALWSGNPNPHLVDQVSELDPGRALDVGSGEGADAIWLAKRGWQVSALDISPVALRRAAQHAAQAGAELARRIQWRHEDVLSWGPDPECFDLISAQFMHLEPLARASLIDRLAGGVAPGGTLLIVGHHLVHGQGADHGVSHQELFFTASQIASLLDTRRWEIVLAADPERSGSAHGETVTVRDAVLRARRRA